MRVDFLIVGGKSGTGPPVIEEVKYYGWHSEITSQKIDFSEGKLVTKGSHRVMLLRHSTQLLNPLIQKLVMENELTEIMRAFGGDLGIDFMIVGGKSRSYLGEKNSKMMAEIVK